MSRFETPINDLSKRIVDYSHRITNKSLTKVILEVDDKTIAVGRKGNYVLSYQANPQEFTRAEASKIIEIVTGVNPRIIPAAEWYEQKLKTIKVHKSIFTILNLFQA